MIFINKLNLVAMMVKKLNLILRDLELLIFLYY